MKVKFFAEVGRVALLTFPLMLASNAVAQQHVLTNADVIKLENAGFGDDVVISMIDSQPGSYQVGPDDMVALKKAGVKDSVIAALLRKSEKATEKGSGATQSGRPTPPTVVSRNLTGPGSPYAQTASQAAGRLKGFSIMDKLRSASQYTVDADMANYRSTVKPPQSFEQYLKDHPSTKGMYVGMPTNALTVLVGDPQRIDSSEGGKQVYIYKQGMTVTVINGKVTEWKGPTT